MMILILFMYIFSFKVFTNFEIINSSILIGILLVLYFILNKRYRYIVFNIIRKKKVLLIFIYLFNIILYCLFISTIQMTYEYSIIKTFLNQFINLLIGVFIYALYVSKNKETLLIYHIIYAFIIQSFIQFISFISPQINQYLNIFRYDNAIIRGQQGYGGIRGLAISGKAFFGLGVGYGLIYIYYFVNWRRLFNKYKSLRFIFLILLIFGGVSAARSSLVGLILGIIYFILGSVFKNKYKISSKVKIQNSKVFVTFLIILIIFMSINIIMKNENLQERFQRMKNFAFQFIYNKQKTGKFTTSSTDILFNRMYFKVKEKTLLIGDAMYTNEDGSYYMHTDAGYMRNILYFGIIGFIILLFYQTKFFIWRDEEFLLENIVILVYILVIHIKGDTLGFGVMMQNILFLVYLMRLFAGKRKHTI